MATATPLAPSGSGWRSVPSHDGTPIAWRVDGPAGTLTRHGRVRAGHTAVVLCNGISCDETYWERVWGPLSEDRPVLRWHYRAHGHSGPPADPDRLTVEDVVGDLGAVLEAAGVRRGVFVGHSFGVQVVFEAWRWHRERIAGIVAVAGAHGHPMPVVAGRNVGLLAFDAIRLMDRLPGATAALQRLVRTRGAYPFVKTTRFVSSAAPRHLLEQWFRHLAAVDFRTIAAMMRHMQLHSADDVLPGIDVPVVAISGESDWSTPPRFARRQAAATRDGRLVLVPRATHVLPIEYPQVVLAEVGHLVDEVAPPSA